MIFSFSEKNQPLLVEDRANLDIFCDFKISNSVVFHESLLMPSMTASLRLKKSILLIGPEINMYPAWCETRRFEMGDHWLWIAPRSLGIFPASYDLNRMDIGQLKDYLINQ